MKDRSVLSLQVKSVRHKPNEQALVGWLFFYGMSTHWVILCRIRFYLRNPFI